jgi:hypothetical protein
MTPPAWIDAKHPIARYEESSWRKFLRRWWWLAMLPILFTIVSSGCSLVGNVPVFVQMAVAANDPSLTWVAAGTVVQTILTALWNINSSVQWVVSVAIGFGAAITIARERESQNWALLRLTPLPPTEIVLAKAVAIVRQFLWPIVITTAVNIVGVALVALGVAGGAVILGQAVPELRSTDIPLWIGIIALLSLAPAVLLMLINTILDILYNTSLGLLASSWATTRANAVAYAIILHFVVNTFVYLPIFFLIIIAAGLSGMLAANISQSPVLAIVALIVIAVVLLFFFRIVIVILSVIVTRHQILRLVE